MPSASALRQTASFAPRARRFPDGAGACGLDGSGPFAVSPAPAGAPLASLAGGALARRFYRWRGASGARYVVTVHDARSDAWLEIEGALILLVARELDGDRRLLRVERDPSPARRAALRAEAAISGPRGSRREIHLHLLAETAAARAAVAADLLTAL
jgi:hypothetical protein